MKLKNLSMAVFSGILLALFLLVFYCVIFIGVNMNYNESHKLYISYSNGLLLVFSLIGMLLFSALYTLLRKIPFNRNTCIATVLFSLAACVIFYFLNEHIAKCIAFYGGWDCGMVANSARWIYEGGALGYDDYYTVYSNNVPITWLLYKLYAISSQMPGYPYNPEFIWIQFQCVMLAAALFFSLMTILIISRRIAFVLMALLLNGLFLGFSPWKIIPYTDASTIAFPILVVFLYTVILSWKSKWRYLLYPTLFFLGMLGGILKASCYVALIAVIIVDFTWLLLDRDSIRNKLKKSALLAAMLAGAFVLAEYCKSEMYQTLNYEYDDTVAVTWPAVVYMGLNEENTGACSDDALQLARAYAGYSPDVRRAAERTLIKERLKEKGFFGLFDFWLRKQTMNYNDGTFSWYQEGFFNAWPYEDITQSRLKWPLRSLYWDDGKYYDIFQMFSQFLWIFIQLGVIIYTFRMFFRALSRLKKRTDEGEEDTLESRIGTVEILIFIGMFLFVMLFEGRARYLYNYTAVFSTMAALGYCAMSHSFRKRKKRARAVDSSAISDSD